MMSAIALMTHPLASGNPSAWARGWGQDSYGVFVDIRVGTVKQRMRWIPPGNFLMGSPESEPGRHKNEGPRHEVELTEGFWLADTPCTQELWQEVTGDNPSRFQSPGRPVEQVSWGDCQSFFERLKDRQPSLELGLPTEAQWERACRAGSDGATWLGDVEIVGVNDAPVLDEIAWYSGNCGVNFDLDEGEASSGWKEKQYPHTLAGTREAKGKRPNPWGLHDMLGNVWEWCSDSWVANYPGGPRTDPTGPEEGAERVVRGGSWYDHARFVGAAYRYGRPPGLRIHYLGFRLSRGQ